MISHEEIVHLLHAYGVLAVFAVVAMESVGVPLPGELVVIVAATLASREGTPLAPLIAAAAVGAIAGDNVGYALGRTFGNRLLLRQGWRLGLREADVKLGQYLFDRYGAYIVFFGRFVAVLRVLAAVLSGANQLPWHKFLLANALGGIAWASLVASTAYWLGRGIGHIHGPLSLALLLAGVAAAVASAVFLRRNRLRLTREAERAYPDPIPGFRSGPSSYRNPRRDPRQQEPTRPCTPTRSSSRGSTRRSSAATPRP